MCNEMNAAIGAHFNEASMNPLYSFSGKSCEVYGCVHSKAISQNHDSSQVLL